MSNENTIRAWKDEDFRNSLSENDRQLLPKHPSGLVELTDAVYIPCSVMATCNGCVLEVTCY